MSSLILICLLIFLLAVYFWWTHRKFFKLAKLVKHDLLRVPLLGVSYLFLGDGESIMKAWKIVGRETLKKGGIIGDWFGPKFLVFIGDPVLANFISRECLEKLDVMAKCMGPILGQCHLIAPVPIWRPRRKLASTLFSTKSMKKYSKVFNNECCILAKNLEPTVGEPVKIFRNILKCTMEVLMKVAADINLDLQNSDHIFLHGVETAMSLMGARFVKPWYYNDFIYQLTPEFKTLSKLKKMAYDLFQENITRGRGNVDNKTSTDIDDKSSTFLEQLILYSKSEKGYTDEELREELLLLVTAGSDTSAVSACFIISMLARFPELQERVYQEITRVLGNEKYIEMEKLSELQYLDAFIKECLRLLTPTPVISRTCEQDVELPNGIVMPAGCGIIIHIWAINRNKEYWGADADDFRPDRFLDPELKHSTIFGSFSFGPRNCVGMRFATISMKMMIITILRRYKILPASQLTGKPDEFRLQYGVTMKDADDFPVILEFRENV